MAKADGKLYCVMQLLMISTKQYSKKKLLIWI